MLFSTIGQIHVFVWMVGAGLAIGALYTLCAWLRRLLCTGFWLTLSIDLLFGLGSAMLMIAAVLIAGGGSLRLYEFLGAALGAILFELGLRPPLEWLLNMFLAYICSFFQRIAKFRLIKVIFR